jgi:hypothetical protein
MRSFLLCFLVMGVVSCTSARVDDGLSGSSNGNNSDAGQLSDGGGQITDGGGLPSDGGAPGDGGSFNISGNQITYTPPGCSYSVTTPEGIIEANFLSAGTAATAPPKHVHASFASDPSSSFAVNWQSEVGATQTTLLYGTNRATLQVASGPTGGVSAQLGHTVRYNSIDDTSGSSTLVHEVHVCGLAPATTYFYKVGNAGAFSPVYSLTTAPAIGSTSAFRFAVSGDSRNDATIWAAAQEAIRAQGAVFQIFSGDAVATGTLQSGWNDFFETTSSGVPASDVMANVPIMMTNGNHESLAVNYLAQFALPQQSGGGESPSAKAWYSFDYGNAHFLVLNDTTVSSDTIAGAEATWARTDLARVNRAVTPWVFVLHHQPEYSCSTVHGSNLDLRAAWQPIFDNAQVDIVFNGHVHNYERSKPIRGFQSGTTTGLIADSLAHGTTYVTAAGVGAPLYDISTGCNFTQKTQKTENYGTVDINGNTLTFKAYDLNTGSVIDQFTVTK